MVWKYKEEKIYSVDENGDLMTEAHYIVKGNGVINIDHIYVEPQFRGQGLADKTMIAMVDYLREKKWKATATCTYASAWFKKHESLYSDIIFHEIDN